MFTWWQTALPYGEITTINHMFCGLNILGKTLSLSWKPWDLPCSSFLGIQLQKVICTSFPPVLQVPVAFWALPLSDQATQSWPPCVYWSLLSLELRDSGKLRPNLPSRGMLGSSQQLHPWLFVITVALWSRGQLSICADDSSANPIWINLSSKILWANISAALQK